MQNLIIIGLIIFGVIITNFAFRQANRERRTLKFRDKPHFKPLALDEEKINDYSKN